MTIDLEVYLKKKPDFEGLLQEDIGLEQVEIPGLSFNGRTFKWYPTPRRCSPNHIYVDENYGQSHYSCLAFLGDYSIEKVAKDEAKIGVKIPQSFVDKVKKHNGSIIADREMFRLLQKHPELEGILKELLGGEECLCGLLRFTQGEPTYHVDIEAKINAPEDVLQAMINLAKFLTIRYDGLIWNQGEGKFGIPDAASLHKLGASAFKIVTKEIVKAGFKWRETRNN